MFSTVLFTTFVTLCGATVFNIRINNDRSIPVYDAIAQLAGNAGPQVSGVVLLKATDMGLRVTGWVEGLQPGQHGFHVHTTGDRTVDCGSMGGHFNPDETQQHGHPQDASRHVGDWGNIVANTDGIAIFDFVDHVATLDSGADTDILGRGIVVHAQPDIFEQPTGAAGARVACGKIIDMGPLVARMRGSASPVADDNE